MNKKDLIRTRPGFKSDWPFIFGTWLPGLYHNNSWFNRIDEQTYYQNYRKVVESILNRSDVLCNMLCLVEDHDVLLGYSVYENTTLHYAFIKPVWRGIGLLKEILPKEVQTITHLTETGDAIAKKHFPNAIFNPFLQPGGTYEKRTHA